MNTNKKAILVMDMPVSCEDCPISYENDYRDMCPIMGSYYNTANERPSWCPLKEMPEKKNLNEMRQKSIEEDCYDDTDGLDEAYLQGKEKGWNECLNEISNK